MFKRWIPASFIAVAMALALAGGAVLAVGSSHGSIHSNVFDRAAEILGIETSALQAAHDQAFREAQDARLQNIVEGLVAGEMISQDEADSFALWIADRPDVADEALLAKLSSTLFRTILGLGPNVRIELGAFGSLNSDTDITDRIAEILEIDPQALADALEDSKKELGEADRLSKLHAAIDVLLADGSISDDEAAALHSWIDDTPQWLLDFDISPLRFPGLQLFGDSFSDKHGFGLKRLPFGRRHFEPREGDFDFKFEFQGPEGSFRFGPGEGEFPFGDEHFQDLFERFDLERFEEFEGLDDDEGFEGLFERFRGYRFGPGFHVEPTEIPDTTATSA
jgi:hypothetical protein